MADIDRDAKWIDWTSDPLRTDPEGPQDELRRHDLKKLRDAVSTLAHFIWYRQTRPGDHLWSIPADRDRDFDLILNDAIDELEALRSASRTTTTPTPDGSWAANDPRRMFVEGAKWWDQLSHGATMWPSDRRAAEAEAERRYPAAPSSSMATTSTPDLVQALIDYQLEVRSGHYTSSRHQVMDLIQRTIEELQAQAGRVPNHGQRL